MSKSFIRKAMLLAGALVVGGVGAYLLVTWKPKVYRVTGTITRDGKPLKWKNDKTLPVLGASTVGLLGSPAGPGALTATCALCPGRPGDGCMLLVIFAPTHRSLATELYRSEGNVWQGTYVLEKVPAGTYLVSIQQMDPIPTDDLLEFRYGLKNSPLTVEVSGNCEKNFDLPKDLPR
jgi:hypothetical protein